MKGISCSMPTGMIGARKRSLGMSFRPAAVMKKGWNCWKCWRIILPRRASFRRKIAVRFVSDDPPQSLIDKMVKTFLQKDGDIRQVLITMVTAPEFWSPAAIREKTKSPFELAIGAVRSLHADNRTALSVVYLDYADGRENVLLPGADGFPG
jgi:uncharacterized protein (DUF1800 family)